MNKEEAKLAKYLIKEEYRDRPPIVAKDLDDPRMNIGEGMEAREKIGEKIKWEQRHKDRVTKLKNTGILSIPTISENGDNVDHFGNKYEIEDVIDVTKTDICPKCNSDNILLIDADSGAYDYCRYQCLECKAIFEIGWSTI